MKYFITKEDEKGNKEGINFHITSGSRTLTFREDGYTIGEFEQRPHSFLAFVLGFAFSTLLFLAVTN